MSDTGTPTPTTTEKPLTIGAVCRELREEFADISISKIRYLEDQRLLEPRRTQGGYRLYTRADVDRLRRILELQRDEFLPLRVIREELDGLGSRPAAGGPGRRRRATAGGVGEDARPRDARRSCWSRPARRRSTCASWRTSAWSAAPPTARTRRTRRTSCASACA